MDTKTQVIQLVQEYSENNIDISNNYELWFKFLKEQGILKTYKEVYEMDLAYLQCERDMDFVKNGEWDVDALIECDQDIVYINDNLWFNHHQEFIEELIGEDKIRQFYIDNNMIPPVTKKEALEWAINQAYIDLNESSNAFSRFDALLFILGHNFGNAKLYLHTSVEKTKEELLKCINEVLEESNKHFGDSDNSIKLWMPHTFKTDDLEHYCDLIRFGGYNVFAIGEEILNADVIILHEDNCKAIVNCYTYENIHQLCDYIAEQFEFYKNEYDNIDDTTYTEEINKKIDFYWKDGKIDFDYAEFNLQNR